MPVHQDSYQRETVLHYIRRFSFVSGTKTPELLFLGLLASITLDVSTRCISKWFILKWNLMLVDLEVCYLHPTHACPKETLVMLVVKTMLFCISSYQKTPGMVERQSNWFTLFNRLWWNGNLTDLLYLRDPGGTAI